MKLINYHWIVIITPTKSCDFVSLHRVENPPTETRAPHRSRSFVENFPTSQTLCRRRDVINGGFVSAENSNYARGHCSRRSTCNTVGATTRPGCLRMVVDDDGRLKLSVMMSRRWCYRLWLLGSMTVLRFRCEIWIFV